MVKAEDLLEQIVTDADLHQHWLATLSYLENQGARKIMAFEPDEDLPLDLLQHAAEEARHAWFFKRQLPRVGGDPNKKHPLLGGFHARRYLHRLDMGISRILRSELDLTGRDLKEGAYLLTTYAIEVRASDIYPRYQKVLRQHGIKISLSSVLKEEDRHLEEIEDALRARPDLDALTDRVRKMEARLYDNFLRAVARAIDRVAVAS